MTIKTKFKLYLTIAIILFILSAIIFIFADGLRRWYSGGFFFVMGELHYPKQSMSIEILNESIRIIQRDKKYAA